MMTAIEIYRTALEGIENSIEKATDHAIEEHLIESSAYNLGRVEALVDFRSAMIDILYEMDASFRGLHSSLLNSKEFFELEI